MADVTPIIVVGAAGRMGRAIIEAAADSPEPYQLVAAAEYPAHPLVGRSLRDIIPGAPEDTPLAGGPPTASPVGAVSIIFATPESTLEWLRWCVSMGNPAVIGTTGFSDAQVAEINAAGEKIPVVFAPNMSVGVNVLCELVAQAARLLGPDFDIEIVEMHHRLKKDSPSGTAKRLAEILHHERQSSYNADTRHGREGIVGQRTNREIGMHAVRGGDVVGDHTVMFASPGERIELTHKASSRETFARGALRAAAWLAKENRAPGVYGMKDVLGL